MSATEDEEAPNASIVGPEIVKNLAKHRMTMERIAKALGIGGSTPYRKKISASGVLDRVNLTASSCRTVTNRTAGLSVVDPASCDGVIGDRQR
jgi:hypothetical protein